MKIIAWLAAVGTLVAAAAYTVISLARWEWNRALFFLLVVLVAEVGLGIALVLRRLATLERARAVDPVVARIIRDNRPPSAERFAWMKTPPDRFNVFITFVVAGGVIVSAIAWVVDRIAARTTSPAGDDKLAAELRAISYPKGGLLLDDITVLAQDVPGADDAQIRKLLRRAGHA